MTTTEDFTNNYLVKNGMAVSAANVNKPTVQLKKEVDELSKKFESISDYTELGTIEDFKNTLE